MQEVDYSDFPTIGSREEQHRWYLKKRTENWQYNKLTGPDAAKYHQAKNLWGKQYYEQKKKKSQATATSQDDELLAGVETLDDATDAAERTKELSRQR